MRDNKVDQFEAMMAWEEGDLSEEGTIILFQSLVDTGLVWKLQGCYVRTAQALIEKGLVALPGGGEGHV